tara:strand:+ start:120 stop:725 length:606 start_codon:yes stop_codon:yes gene_type:complete
MDYKNGKIYKIVCNVTGKQYIGSTTQTLVQRLTKHRGYYRERLKDMLNRRLASSWKIIENGDYRIILIQDYPCERKEQLLMRERFFIENLECVNKTCPIRSREEVLEFKRLEWHNRSDETKAIRSVRHLCECGSHYQSHHKHRHQRTKKHINFTGIQPPPIVPRTESIQKKVYTCECGTTLTYKNKTNHEKTKKHIKFLEQ